MGWRFSARFIITGLVLRGLNSCLQVKLETAVTTDGIFIRVRKAMFNHYTHLGAWVNHPTEWGKALIFLIATWQNNHLNTGSCKLGEV